MMMHTVTWLCVGPPSRLQGSLRSWIQHQPSSETAPNADRYSYSLGSLVIPWRSYELSGIKCYLCMRGLDDLRGTDGA